jgi:hypothetical protein
MSGAALVAAAAGRYAGPVSSRLWSQGTESLVLGYQKHLRLPKPEIFDASAYGCTSNAPTLAPVFSHSREAALASRLI